MSGPPENRLTFLAFQIISRRGLSSILTSGNLTSYPATCARATASFSVLSDAVNAVKSELLERKRNDLADVVGSLQQAEGQKLNLTAAWHLERLRLRNAKLEGEDGGDDGRTIALLEEGVRSLQKRIAATVGTINEAIEELRCAAADEE